MRSLILRARGLSSIAIVIFFWGLLIVPFLGRAHLLTIVAASFFISCVVAIFATLIEVWQEDVFWAAFKEEIPRGWGDRGSLQPKVDAGLEFLALEVSWELPTATERFARACHAAKYYGFRVRENWREYLEEAKPPELSIL